MRRFPPSIIYKYLDLLSTQRIQTYNSHEHNTTPPFQTLVQSPLGAQSTELVSLYIGYWTLNNYYYYYYYSRFPPIPPTPTQTQTHVRHSSCSQKIVNPNPNPLIQSNPTSPRAKYIHISHTPTTPLIRRTIFIPITSAGQYLNRVYHPHTHALH